MARIFELLGSGWRNFRDAIAVAGLILRIDGETDLGKAPTLHACDGVPTRDEPEGSIAASRAGFYRREGGAWVASASSDASAETGITASTGSSGTGATGSEGTGATSSSGTGATGSASTGITASTGSSGTDATGSEGTGATGTGNASVTAAAPEYRVADFTQSPPSTAGGAILATQSANFDITTWATFTQPDCVRNAQVVFSGTWDGGNVEITGIGMDGSDVVETIVAAAGTTVEGVKGFRYIRRARNLGARTAGSVDLQKGPKIGVPTGGRVPTLGEVYETTSGGRLAGCSISSVGLINLGASPPNGTRRYYAAYTLATTYADGGHTHTGPAHTHTGPAHTHTVGITDGGHTHTGPAHTHTGPAHTHTGPAHTHTVGITDPGHAHG